MKKGGLWSVPYFPCKRRGVAGALFRNCRELDRCTGVFRGKSLFVIENRDLLPVFGLALSLHRFPTPT